MIEVLQILKLEALKKIFVPWHLMFDLLFRGTECSHMLYFLRLFIYKSTYLLFLHVENGFPN